LPEKEHIWKPHGDFFLYTKKVKKVNQLNDKNTFFYNKIFEVNLNKDSHLTSQRRQPPSSVVTESHLSRQQDTVVHIHQTTYAVNVG
jgi:hypothetical protein